jgi:4-amino-4-deoxy-L-arabinose transferase-like glycosyltransferase
LWDKLKRVLSNPGFIVIVAFLARMVYLYISFRMYQVPMVRDNMQFGAETGAVAAAIASGRGFSSPLWMKHTGPTAWLTPIYPYLLAGVFKLFGIFSFTSNLVIRTMDIAFASFACWPIYAIGKRTFGERVGLASAWLWVFLPSGIYFPVSWVWDTALTGLWMALLFAATLWLRGSERRWAWVGYGALWGIGAMINPSVLSVLPFLALWAIWPLRKRLRRAAQLALISSAVFLACITPWTVRNYLVFHKLIPLRSNFGLEFWLGNGPGVPAGWAPWLHPTNNAEQAREYARMTEIPYMAEKQREAWAFVRSHPVTTAHFVLKRFGDTWLGMWGPPADIWHYAPLDLKLGIVWNCLFSMLSFLGVLFACHEGNEAAPPFAFMMLVFPLLFYLTHSSPRYRYPMDAIMGILTVYAVAYLLSWCAERSRLVRTVSQSAAGEGE